MLLKSQKNFLKKFNICFDLDLTSPLRNIRDIKKALKKYLIMKKPIICFQLPIQKNPYFNMVEKK